MKRPKDSWKDYLRENKGFNGAAENSFKIYESKYLKEKVKPAEKFSTTTLIPGKIYSFTHSTELIPNKSIKYVDKRPVILSLGRIKIDDFVYEAGINLNIIPPQIKMIILDKIYISYKNQIEINEKGILEGRNNSKGLPLSYDIAKKILDKTGFETAFFVYDRRKMKGIKIFDYVDWVTIISLDTKAIVGLPLNKIFNEYIERMNKRIDRLTEIKNTFE